jgi:hypothetical protein
MYWRVASGDTTCCHNNWLWFRDLNVANVYTHLWSFQVICLSQIRNLLVRYPALEWPSAAVVGDARILQDEYLKMSIMILQSMEYMLQGEFMLYGLSSVGFPLRTACTTLRMDGSERGRAVYETLGRTVIDRCRDRGIHHYATFLLSQECKG